MGRWVDDEDRVGRMRCAGDISGRWAGDGNYLRVMIPCVCMQIRYHDKRCVSAVQKQRKMSDHKSVERVFTFTHRKNTKVVSSARII